MRTRSYSLAVLVAVLALIAASCGDSTEDTTTTTEGTTATTAAATTTTGAATTQAPETTEAMGEPVTIRIMYHAASPGNDDTVLSELVDRFMADNPDIEVAIDFVGRDVLDDTLPLQLESGEGPDIVRLLIPSGFVHRDYFLDLRPYLDDTYYWDENLGDSNAFLSGGTDALYGFNTDTTITGPYIDRTLFEQAGVPVPSDTSDQVTWQEWADAATQVKDALGLPEAMVMDPSGHRFAGPAISMGATYLDADGNPQLVGDQGFKDMLQLLVDWHQNGVMPLEVWGGAEGQSLDAAGEFINGNAPFYMSGSWQVGRFEDEIGDAFDWEVVPNPCGPGGCTGMPGGGFLTGLTETEHPEAVARLMDYLASEDVYGEFAARTLLIPNHKGLAEKGVDFQTTTQLGADALNVWLASSVSETAQNLVSSPFGGTIFDVTAQRIKQAVVGELSVDEAIQAMQDDLDEAMSAGG